MPKVRLRKTIPFYSLTLGLHLLGIVLLLVAAQEAPKFFGLGVLAIRWVCATPLMPTTSQPLTTQCDGC